MQTSLAPRESIQEMAARFAFPHLSLQQRIEVAAYFKAEHRGFAPGHALDDWLEAEHGFAC